MIGIIKRVKGRTIICLKKDEKRYVTLIYNDKEVLISREDFTCESTTNRFKFATTNEGYKYIQ